MYRLLFLVAAATANTLVFNQPGTYSFDSRDYDLPFTVELWGAGGGGTSFESTNPNLSQGGGSGAYIAIQIDIHDIFMITVGRGGSGDLSLDDCSCFDHCHTSGASNGGSTSIFTNNGTIAIAEGGYAGSTNVSVSYVYTDNTFINVIEIRDGELGINGWGGQPNAGSAGYYSMCSCTLPSSGKQPGGGGGGIIGNCDCMNNIAYIPACGSGANGSVSISG